MLHIARQLMINILDITTRNLSIKYTSEYSSPFALLQTSFFLSACLLLYNPILLLIVVKFFSNSSFMIDTIAIVMLPKPYLNLRLHEIFHY